MSQENQKLPENSYICIQAFMVNDLELFGNELMVYGLIYGFNMDKNTEFSGSLSYIQKWLNCNSKQTVVNVLDKLINRNLITKVSTTNNPRSCNHYIINWDTLNDFTSTKNGLVQNLDQLNKADNMADTTSLKNGLVQKVDATSPKIRPVTSPNFRPNNINNNINNINSNSPRDNFTLSTPTLEDVMKHAKTYGNDLFIDAEYFHYHNEKHNWKDNNGSPIRSWKALFNNWNQLQKQKAQAKEKEDEEQKKQASQRYEQLKAQRTKEENQYKENAVKNTNLSCPKCGKTFPDPSITYSPTDNAFYCSCCNTSWQAYNPLNSKEKQAV